MMPLNETNPNPTGDRVMRISKFFATLAAATAFIAVGAAALPSHAQAWVVYRGCYGCGYRVFVPAAPVVVVPPPVYYAPQPVYVAPPAYIARQPVWVPPHYEGAYFVPGHWA
jgi:hypothetical protein